MDNLIKINVEDLVDMIDGYKDGEKRQDKPAVVWFENVDGDLLEYGPHGDYMGFATGISDEDDSIALNLESGSPYTDHEYLIDGDRARKITPEERRQFVVASAIKPSTRVYIHTSFTPYMGENGLDSVEYGKMVHDILHLPVLLLFPIAFKEKIKADFSGYQEYLCTDSLEDVKQRWLARAAEKDEDGIQRVDNFILDFLKTAPNEYLSYEFDPSKHTMMHVTYGKWEELGGRIRKKLRSLLKATMDDDADREATTAALRSLYVEGNIDFDRLSAIVGAITPERWHKWYEDNKFDLRDNKKCSEDGDRMTAVKTALVLASGNLPTDALEAVLKHHDLM